MRKTERCRDLIGKTVRVKCQIETRGHVFYEAGHRFRVTSTWRGKFELESLVDHSRVRGMVRDDMEIVR